MAIISKFIECEDILKIVTKYCKDNSMSLSEYARLSNVSKAWLSRLFRENNNISLQVAERLLNVAGYYFEIKNNKKTAVIKKKRLNKVGNHEINR